MYMHMDISGGPGAPFTAQPTTSSTPSPHGTGRNGDGEASRHAVHTGDGLPRQIASIVAENHELRAEVDRLRADRARMLDVQNRLMDVLGCKAPERLVHDVRNVLNERELYRALADTIQD
jgi:hypothetical protein